jgi:ubiquinone biosynthesis monooxygenase Coq7
VNSPASKTVDVASLQRSPRLLDQVIGELDRCVRTLAGTHAAARPCPGDPLPENASDRDQRARTAALMRVNHSGEIAAQALYSGQATTARDAGIRATLTAAAQEETDHLLWCSQRIRELGGRESLLNPLWYAGSFVIGALAGLAGDRTSLGFVAETERQVVQHLESHLDRLPADDVRTRAIIEQMRADEARHGSVATASGGRGLPDAVRRLMRVTARIMTSTAARF